MEKGESAKVEAKVEAPKKVEVEKKEKKEAEPIIDSYNGGKNDKYTWSQ